VVEDRNLLKNIDGVMAKKHKKHKEEKENRRKPLRHKNL